MSNVFIEPPYAMPPGIPDVIYASRIMGGAIVLGNGSLESEGFQTGISGWKIHGDGSVEFNNGVFRGSLEASSIDIPDTSTANSFHVDSSGNMWIGSTLLAGAPFYVLNDGSAVANNIVITGSSSVVGSTVVGTLDASTINVTNLTADNIVTGTLNGTLVGSGVDAGVLTTGDLDIARIVDLSIVEDKLADLAVTTAKLANLSITETKIDDDSISTPKLQALSVETSKLAALSVETDKLAANAVIASKIAALAVETDKLAANAVTAAKLSSIVMEVGKYIQSTSYVTGTTGWRINADGSAEFSNVTVRGTIEANSGRFGPTAGSRFVIASGRMDCYSGATYRGRIVYDDGTYGNGLGLQIDSSSNSGFSNTKPGLAVSDSYGVKIWAGSSSHNIHIGSLDTNIPYPDNVIHYAITSHTFKVGSSGDTVAIVETQGNGQGRIQLTGADTGEEGGEILLLTSDGGDNNVYLDAYQFTSSNNVYFRVQNGTIPCLKIRMDQSAYDFAVGATRRAAYIDDAANLGTISSSRKYKKNIRDYNFGDIWERAEKVKVKKFNRKKRDVEEYGPDNDKVLELGMIAEDMFEAFPEFCYLDKDGNPDGIAYEQLPLLHHAMLMDLNARLKRLERV